VPFEDLAESYSSSLLTYFSSEILLVESDFIQENRISYSYWALTLCEPTCQKYWRGKQKFRGENVVKSDKGMGVLKYWGVHPGCPKVYAYV